MQRIALVLLGLAGFVGTVWALRREYDRHVAMEFGVWFGVVWLLAGSAALVVIGVTDLS